MYLIRADRYPRIQPIPTKLGPQPDRAGAPLFYPVKKLKKRPFPMKKLKK